jgi:hypothetical protein
MFPVTGLKLSFPSQTENQVLVSDRPAASNISRDRGAKKASGYVLVAQFPTYHMNIMLEN